MKKGYLKANWTSIAVVIAFIAGAIYSKDIMIGVITLVFVGVLAVNYARFDEEETMHNEWWNGLNKGEKSSLYEKANSKNTEEEDK